MRVFVLEDDKVRMVVLRAALMNHEVVHAWDMREVEEKLKQGPFDLFLLDHDLGERVYVDVADGNTGSAFCRRADAQAAMAGKVVIVHSYNKAGAENMVSLVPGAVWQPFGPGLINMLQVGDA